MSATAQCKIFSILTLKCDNFKTWMIVGMHILTLFLLMLKAKSESDPRTEILALQIQSLKL